MGNAGITGNVLQAQRCFQIRAEPGTKSQSTQGCSPVNRQPRSRWGQPNPEGKHDANQCKYHLPSPSHFYVFHEHFSLSFWENYKQHLYKLSISLEILSMYLIIFLTVFFPSFSFLFPFFQSKPMMFFPLSPIFSPLFSSLSN